MKVSNVQNNVFKGKICFHAPRIGVKERFNWIAEEEAERKMIFNAKNEGDGYFAQADTKNIEAITPSFVLAKDDDGNCVMIDYKKEFIDNSNASDINKQMYAMTAYNTAKDDEDMVVHANFKA